jgi:monofunctional biosynthetic peptidoglycan transglycosylase
MKIARNREPLHSRARPRKGGRPFRFWRWLLSAILLFVVVSVLWVLAYTVVAPPVTFTMLGDSRGAQRTWRALDEIDPDMARAVIAGEDAKFCSHDGFDREAIADAWSRYREGGRIRGGSTISQQTAKNAFLWQGGGFFRKGLEAWFTFLMENIWTKHRIMEVYLNIAETGIGTYGVEAGVRRYFDHGADRMTPTEAARIAAVLPLPKKRGAVAPTGFTRRYGGSILSRMGVVRREGLDDCLRTGAEGEPAETTPRPSRSRDAERALEALVPPPDPVPPADNGGEEPVSEEIVETVVEEEEPAEEPAVVEPEEPQPAEPLPDGEPL